MASELVPICDIEQQLRNVAHEVHEKVVENISSRGSVESMCLKDMIIPPGLKFSTFNSSTLAILELFYSIKFDVDSKPEPITFLIFYDSESKIVEGRLKILDELSCDLKSFVRNYSTPIPSFGYDGIPFGMPFIPIPASKFPPISELHRRSIFGFESYLSNQNFRTWELKVKDLFQTRPAAYSKRRSSKDESENSQKSSWTILDTLINEQSNSNSRLSWLPFELIEVIYLHVQSIWKEHVQTGGVFASVVAKVKFPQPKGINVNMMPIKLCDSRSIPGNMKQYLPMIAACPIDQAEYDEIGYLTIHESKIEADGKSQRRGGIHTETPGKIWVESYQDPALDTKEGGSWRLEEFGPIAWGGGLYDSNLESNYHYVGGLYMASNVSDSCRVWNCKVINPEEIVGPLGDLEHMASYLGEGETLEAGDLVWMTDCTPHESLPLKKGTYRQYFRLVTSQVSVWYADHSTPNPLGITPPDHVTIVHGNKFGLTEQQYPRNVCTELASATGTSKRSAKSFFTKMKANLKLPGTKK